MTLGSPSAASAAIARPASRGDWQALVVLLAVALLVRLVVFIGYQGHDDRSYIAFAWMFAHGGDFAMRGIADPWTGRMLAWLPSALYIRLFGDSEWVLVLHSLLCSLGSVAIAFGVVRQFHGRHAALVAAGMMAVLPIDVLYGTRAFGDQGTGTLCVATLACFLMTLHTRSSRWALGTGLAWGLAYLSKETAMLMLVPFLLVLWMRRDMPWRLVGIAASGLALVVAFELLFWLFQTGDALYRWHATLGSRERIVPPPKAIVSWIDWIPSPIPSEIMRSNNTLLDALLMLTTNEEWGLLFFLALPLSLLACKRGDAVLRAVAVFMLAMVLLLAFLPLHFPHYTLGRDPRHFTAVSLPAVWLVAVWLVQQRALLRRALMSLFALSWGVCLIVGVVSSDIGTARALAAYALEHAESRIWTNNIIASNIVVLSGFDSPAQVGVVKFHQGRVVDGGGLSNPMRAMRPETPVTRQVSDLAGQLVVLPDGVAPEPGWILVKEFAPQPGPIATALRRVLVSLGVPVRLADKVAPSDGNQLRLYRAA
jgi:4-amino-4-deoxy-L-arabinose transferase-like glycosyltransferase